MNIRKHIDLAEMRGAGARLAQQQAGRAVRRLEALLWRAAGDGSDPLSEASRHLVRAGGKRLRPRLVVLCALASGRRRPGVLRIALAAEAVHSATLLHDDVIDVAPTRRGQPSVPVQYGNAVSVLAGDAWFATAIELVSGAGAPRALTELVRTIQGMVRAECLQLAQRTAPLIDEETAWKILVGKTAGLFRWCALAGAMAAGASRAHEASLAGFGTHLGAAFQLVDDLDDLGTPAKAGEDLAQGAVTLPIVLACKERPELREAVAAVVRDAAAGTCAAEVAGQTVAEAVFSTGARAEVLRRIRHEVDRALTSLACLPESPYREALAEAALFLSPKPNQESPMDDASTITLKLGRFVKFREEKFGGVLFETRQEKVFTLNATGAAVIKAITEGQADLTRHLRERFDDAAGSMDTQVAAFVDQLRAAGLLVEEAATP